MLRAGLVVLLAVGVSLAATALSGHYGFWSWALGGGASTTIDQHPDQERAPVGWTAFGVALLRATESARADRLFNDPIATRLFELSNFRGGAPLGGRLAVQLVTWIPLLQRIPKLQALFTLVAVRTEFIDRHIKEFLEQNRREAHRTQLVIIGAGLDARAFRLAPLLVQTESMVFEVDFPGMLAEKRRLFELSGFDYGSLEHVQHIGSDLTRGGALKSALTSSKCKFDPNLRTIWLLEGLTGYLDKAELTVVLETLQSLSAPSSRIIATWLGEEAETKTPMHRFFTKLPTTVVGPWGFSKEVEVTSVKDAADAVGRSHGSRQYFLSCNDT